MPTINQPPGQARFGGKASKDAGGGLVLDNVHFVKCTFDAPATDRGNQVLSYAALQGDSIFSLAGTLSIPDP